MSYDTFLRAKAAAEQTGRQREQDTYVSQQRNALMGAGQQFAAGNLSGASNALAGAGMLDDALAVSRHAQTQQATEQDRRFDAIAAVASGLRRLPAEQRWQAYQTRGLTGLKAHGVGDDIIGMITPEMMADADLDSVITMYGGETPNAPSGYRFKNDGSLEAIPGGPEAPENQRWQVTPYGLIPPRGWKPEQGMPQGQSLGAGIPQGWSSAPPGGPARPNQPPSAPAAGGGERSQPVSVSFRSSQEAQAAIQSLVPGVRVTSGRRSEADNRRVGGAPGSFHLQDRARDLVPPAGMSMAQLAAKMRQQGFRALDEGDHVHVSW